MVRGSYTVISTSSTDFLVTGYADVDGDSTNNSYRYQVDQRCPDYLNSIY